MCHLFLIFSFVQSSATLKKYVYHRVHSIMILGIICSFVLVFLLVGVAYCQMKSTVEATTPVDAVNMITRHADSTAPATPATRGTQNSTQSTTEASESINSSAVTEPSAPRAPSAPSRGSADASFPVKKTAAQNVSVDAANPTASTNPTNPTNPAELADPASPANHQRIDLKRLFDGGADAPILERDVLKTQTYFTDRTGVIEGKTADFSNNVTGLWSRSVNIEFNSPDCVIKDPIDAWVPQLYGIAIPPRKEADIPRMVPSHDMQKTEQYQKFIQEVMTTKQYNKGLQATDMLATTSMLIEDYDPSGGK